VGDENWFPLAEGHPRARALNPESEAAIADFVRDNCPPRGWHDTNPPEALVPRFLFNTG
jgi:hypothetical protein